MTEQINNSGIVIIGGGQVNVRENLAVGPGARAISLSPAADTLEDEQSAAPIPEASSPSGGTATQQRWDAFISHATEDKAGFVDSLARVLRQKGLQIWYDEFTLRVGDSLRQSIDRGLASSRFGIVVLSKHFFAKNWPQEE